MGGACSWSSETMASSPASSFEEDLNIRSLSLEKNDIDTPGGLRLSLTAPAVGWKAPHVSSDGAGARTTHGARTAPWTSRPHTISAAATVNIAAQSARRP